MSYSSGQLDEFLAECDEITQRIAKNLALIEKQETDPTLIDALYRDFHTLKGSSNLYSFKQLGSLSHAMESSLESYRETKTAKIDAPIVDILFDSLKLIEKLVAQIRLSGQEPDLLQDLETLIPRLVEARDLCLKTDHQLSRDVILPSETSENTSMSQSLEQPKKPEHAKLKEGGVSVKEKVASQEPVREDAPAVPSSSSESPASIRVNVSLLDKLMNLVGEMVLVRNQVSQYSVDSDDLEFIKLSQRLSGVTSELQEEVMRTRMQPLGNVLDKFNRVVRDLSKDLGKKIELKVFGAETLLDKSLLEAVKDPLTHLVRNACDHGIELPEERRSKGKLDIGTVTIRAFHESGQVVVEMSDDGKGLDRQKLITKAIECGLTKAELAKNLSDKEVFNFIFEPGFSTAQKVTTVSGRGVGMDVVRTNIEKIGGAIELSSQLHHGTTVRLRIPLTLAIVPALVVRSGSERFCIPQVKLVELVRCLKEGDPNSEEGQHRIERLQDKPMLRLRGQLLPLVDLREVLELNKNSEDRADDLSRESSTVNVVVLNADGRHFGLIVEEIQDTSDIVVKPLTKFLKAISVYSGATLMGDGSVALILDVLGLSERATIKSESKSKMKTEAADAAAKRAELQEFLLVRLASKGNYALPLCLVKRLEEFDRKQVEYSGERELIRYRDSILPLIGLNQFFGFSDQRSETEKEKYNVVVVQKFGKNFGLVVDSIVDVISTDNPIDDTVRDREGLLGNLVLPHGITTVVDPLGIVDRESSKLNTAGFEDSRGRSQERPKRIVLAEDSSFFRKLIKRALEKNGYHVTEFENGRKALEFLQGIDRAKVDGLVSDIEMPEMTGLELARGVRSLEGWKDLPMTAVTSRFSESDIANGKEAGFDLYFEKLNPEQLIKGLGELLGRKGAAHGA